MNNKKQYGGTIMKQFNLEEYLAMPTRKLVTRSGKTVRKIICTDARGKFPVIALMERCGTTNEEAISYTKDGAFLPNREHPYDLFFALEKHQGWVILLQDLNGSAFVGSPIIYETKENAEKDGKKSDNYISTAKIEWEE